MSLFSIHIRFVVLCYSTIVALVLYQTGSSGTGTIAALASMGITLLFLLLSNKHGVGKDGMLLLCGVLYLFVSQMALMTDTRILFKCLVQIFFTAMMCCITLTDEEHRYLKKIYELSMVVYSIIIIRAITQNPLDYVHASIPLFGSVFDPNFIGLPIVLGTSLLLYDIFHSSKKIFIFLYAIAFLICVWAIVQTSSRGNLLGLFLSSILVLMNYFFRNRQKNRINFGLLLVIFAIIYVFYSLMIGYEENFARMTQLEEGADNSRFYLWNISINQFIKKPFFGAGLGSMASNYGHATHNTYIEILSETGIFGFCIFIPFLCKMYLKARSYDRSMSIMIITMYFLIFFLDSFDNRCVWAVLGWTAMLPKTNNINMRYGNEINNITDS